MGVRGELHIERGSIVWLIRKWVQSICFGSIFTCFGGISIANWNLALRVGITSLRSERQALIWSETQQLSALAHSNTAQQLKAGHTQHNIPLKLQSVVEPFWAARITTNALTSIKGESCFQGCLFWQELVLFCLQNLWDTVPSVLQKLQGSMQGSKVRTWWNLFLILPGKSLLYHAQIWQERRLALIFPKILAGPGVHRQPSWCQGCSLLWFGHVILFIFFSSEAESKNMTVFLV